MRCWNNFLNGLRCGHQHVSSCPSKSWNFSSKTLTGDANDDVAVPLSLPAMVADVDRETGASSELGGDAA